MKHRRVLGDEMQPENVYHCMSRCVGGEDKLDRTSRDVLAAMIWKVAEFCGVEIITYAVLPNHFHLLARVPQARSVNDDELLRRYALLHPKPNGFQNARIEVIAGWLRNNSPEGVAWRERQLALMYHLPSYLKLLKHRFTRWYNATHRRFGTVWAERYKSVLVENQRHSVLTVSAYIDLNAVRKGLVADPKDYPWCGYAEAVRGNRRARLGLSAACPHATWGKVQADYRTALYAIGSAPRERGNTIPDAAYREVLARNGELSLPEILRLRWRHLSVARVLGSHAFVQLNFVDSTSPHPFRQPLLTLPRHKPNRNHIPNLTSVTYTVNF